MTGTTSGGVSVTCPESGSLVLSGTLANINAYQASASAPTYVPVANANGSVILTEDSIRGADVIAGQPRAHTNVSTINIAAVNDAPVNTLPASFATNEDTSVQLTGLS